MTSAVAETARYMYAISRDLEPDQLRDVSGLREGSLELVRHRGLDAVVGDVPLDEFGEEGLRQNLERLSWLEEVARAHDEVVRGVAALGPTAPLRLATICLDDDAVRQRLDEWHDELTQVLDRIAGRAEWSVKVIAPPRQPEPAGAPAEVSGAEFLRRRKAQAELREQQHADAAGVAEQIHQGLSAAAVASRLLAPQDPQLTGHVGTMVLNGAYLVEVEEGEGFAARVRELTDHHPDLRIESAGPWPPYSFAVLEQS